MSDGEIAVGVSGGDDAGELATVVEDNIDAIVPDDVTVCDDDTVGAPDDTGAVAAALTDEDDRRFDLRRDVGDSVGERQPGEGWRDRRGDCFSRSRVIVMSMVSALFSLALALADGDRDLAWLSTAGYADGDALANAVSCQLLLKLLDLADSSTVNGEDDIAEHHPGRVRGTAGFDGDDEQSEFLTVIEGPSQRLRQANA